MFQIVTRRNWNAFFLKNLIFTELPQNDYMTVKHQLCLPPAGGYISQYTTTCGEVLGFYILDHASKFVVSFFSCSNFFHGKFSKICFITTLKKLYRFYWFSVYMSFGMIYLNRPGQLSPIITRN